MALSLRNRRLHGGLALSLCTFLVFGPATAKGPGKVLDGQTWSNGPDLANVSLDDLEKSSHRKGNTVAPVTIVEFADFCCPSCAKTHLKLMDLVANHKDKISLIYHQFPLSMHQQAQHASTLSEQLNDNDFWAFAANIYQSGKKLSKEDFDRIYASYHGKRSRTEKAASEKVAADLKVSHDYRVNSTPTCFVFVDRKPVAITHVDTKEILSNPDVAKILSQSAK